MLNPVHLRTLITVIRTGSFAEAARRLGYTGSAVSQQISALERTVRMPLFERDARSIRPTPVAQLLASRAQDILASIDVLEDEARRMAAGTIGHLRVGSFPTASQRLLPHALSTLVGAQPGVEVVLDEGEPTELLIALQDRELDIILAYWYDLVPRPWPRSLNLSPLLYEDLFLLIPERHPLAGATEIGLRDLAAEKWITTRHGSAGASCLRRACAEVGFEPAVEFRSNDYDVIRGFVRFGLGIALVPAMCHVESEGVVAVSIAGLKVKRHVGVLYHRAGSNPAIVGALGALSAAAVHLADHMTGIHPGTPQRA